MLPAAAHQAEIASLACFLLEQTLIPSPEHYDVFFFSFISRGFVVGECFSKAWEIEFFWYHEIAGAAQLLCILLSHQQ